MTTEPTLSYFPFMRLPKELRLGVLEYSDLVDSRYGSKYQQFIAYRQGRIQVGSLHANRRTHTNKLSCDHCPHILSSSLLRVSKTLHEEAFEVMLTCNLLVLESGHAQNLVFLRSLSPLLRARIQHLDIRFEEPDFEDGNDQYCCYFRNIPDFDHLIDYISRHMNLGRLYLSLDMLDDYLGFDSWDWFTRPLSMLALRAIKRITQPLIKLRGIKSFHVFLSMHMGYEYIMERIAAGPGYDSSMDGKPPSNLRTPLACHIFGDESDHWCPCIDFGLARDPDPDESEEQYIASCKHPEVFTNIDVPTRHPFRLLPGPEKREICTWYDHKAYVEALNMARSGLLPGNQTLGKHPALLPGPQKADIALDVIALENS